LVVRGLIAALAKRTKKADETLSEHTQFSDDTKIVWLDTHVEESADNVDNVVGMHRSKHEVSG
jgi:hypothetical protein